MGSPWPSGRARPPGAGRCGPGHRPPPRGALWNVLCHPAAGPARFRRPTFPPPDTSSPETPESSAHWSKRCLRGAEFITWALPRLPLTSGPTDAHRSHTPLLPSPPFSPEVGDRARAPITQALALLSGQTGRGWRCVRKPPGAPALGLVATRSPLGLSRPPGPQAFPQPAPSPVPRAQQGLLCTWPRGPHPWARFRTRSREIGRASCRERVSSPV